MTGLVLLAAVLALSTVAGLVLRSRAGRFRDTAPADTSAGASPPPVPAVARATPDERDDARDVLAALSAAPGERATLLQFSSAFCAPCRATRRVLADVARVVPGVAHVEVDAEQHLDVVRRLGIVKTPTTLVLDAGGRVVSRAAGQPRPAAVLSALERALP